MIVTKLDFENGFNTSIIDRLLNKIVVNKSEIKNHIVLDVYLQIIDKNIYEITCKNKSSDILLISDKKVRLFLILHITGIKRKFEN